MKYAVSHKKENVSGFFAGRTGRPLGSEKFITRLERMLERVLRCQKAGRKRKK
jgi:hypothetical protein